MIFLVSLPCLSECSIVYYVILMQENGDGSEPHSRARTPSPERDKHSRPSKRRKLRHKVLKFTDGTALFPHFTLNDANRRFTPVVTKGIITESEARELFNLYGHVPLISSLLLTTVIYPRFYHGCSTFLYVNGLAQLRPFS